MREPSFGTTKNAAAVKLIDMHVKAATCAHWLGNYYLVLNTIIGSYCRIDYFLYNGLK